MRTTLPPRSLILIVSLFLIGCPRPPLRFGPHGVYSDPQALLQEVDRRGAQVFSVQAQARVDIKTPKQSGTVDQFIAARREALLHLETLNFFGKPTAVMASNGEQFGLYLDQEGSFYSGPATAQNIARLLPMAIEPQEIVRLLLGEVPRIVPDQMHRLRFTIDEDARAYKVILTRGSVTQQLWIDTETLRPIRSEIRGIPGYDLQLERYRSFKGVLFPLTIKLAAVQANGQSKDLAFTVRYQDDTEVNIALDEDLFLLFPPPNAKTFQLDGSGNQVH